MQHRKSISCSPVRFSFLFFFSFSLPPFRFTFFFFTYFFFHVVRSRARETPLDLPAVYNSLAALSRGTGNRSLVPFSFPFRAERNAALPIARGRFSLRLWTLMNRIRYYHSPFNPPPSPSHSPHTHIHAAAHSRSSNSGVGPRFFLFLGRCCVTLCGCDTLHLVQPIYVHISFSSSRSLAAHMKPTLRLFYCPAWLPR